MHNAASDAIKNGFDVFQARNAEAIANGKSVLELLSDGPELKFNFQVTPPSLQEAA